MTLLQVVGVLVGLLIAVGIAYTLAEWLRERNGDG